LVCGIVRLCDLDGDGLPGEFIFAYAIRRGALVCAAGAGTVWLDVVAAGGYGTIDGVLGCAPAYCGAVAVSAAVSRCVFVGVAEDSPA
jgi:hypothetical protein